MLKAVTVFMSSGANMILLRDTNPVRGVSL